MRKTVIAFPIDRVAKATRPLTPAHQPTSAARPTLVGRWRINPGTGRLEQQWVAIERITVLAADGAA